MRTQSFLSCTARSSNVESIATQQPYTKTIDHKIVSHPVPHNFFRWDISVICPVIIKLIETVFTCLLFRHYDRIDQTGFVRPFFLNRAMAKNRRPSCNSASYSRALLPGVVRSEVAFTPASKNTTRRAGFKPIWPISSNRAPRYAY